MKKSFFGAILASLLFSGSASAALITSTVFSADFLPSEGYMPGNLNGQNGILAQSNGSTVNAVDTSGTGSVTSSAGGFTRFRFGTSLAGQTVAVGDMILIEVGGLSILSDGANDNSIVIGLSQFGQFSGSGSVAIGSQLTLDLANGNNIFVEDAAFAISPSRVDIGFDIGDSFDYGVKLTAETAGDVGSALYTIDHLINGVSLLTQTNQMANLATSDAFGNELRGIFQDQDSPTGVSYSLDSVSLSTVAVAVPEPSSFAMVVCVGVVGLVAHRRRRS